MANPENPSGTPPNKAQKAVALSHDKEGEGTPKVVAKGRGYVAEQILQIAFASGVKVREDADLVEVLEALDLESEIPMEAFAAVAEILNYVYRANAKYSKETDDSQTRNEETTPPLIP